MNDQYKLRLLKHKINDHFIKNIIYYYTRIPFDLRIELVKFIDEEHNYNLYYPLLKDSTNYNKNMKQIISTSLKQYFAYTYEVNNKLNTLPKHKTFCKDIINLVQKYIYEEKTKLYEILWDNIDKSDTWNIYKKHYLESIYFLTKHMINVNYSFSFVLQLLKRFYKDNNIITDTKIVY